MSKLKSILDYYELIYALYPTIKKSDIKRILQYGWKSFYLHNSYGGDVLISRGKFWLYSGTMMNDSLKFFNYYKRKMVIKIRVLYKKFKTVWDGYYYFGLNRTLYEQYLSLKNKKGRPKKYFTFSKIMLYKIKDECSILENLAIALFRIPLGIDLGFSVFKMELYTDKAEFLCERTPLKFNDILSSEYEYQYIKDSKKKL